MSDPPTHEVLTDESPVSLGYEMEAIFFPEIHLDNEAAFRFAGELAAHLDIGSVKIESNQWTLVGSGNAKGAKVVLKTRSVLFSVSRPSQRGEWYDERFQIVLTRLWGLAEPRIILQSRALVRVLVPVDGDARVFIGTRIMNMPPSRLGPMSRPLHVLGIRMFFPPFEADEDSSEDSRDWGVDTKVESYINDPSKLFVEANARWEEPAEWTKEHVNSLVGRLDTTHEFVTTQLLPFLSHEEEGDDGDDEE